MTESGLQVIEGCGYGFLFARKFHPAMKNVAAVRKELGTPTVFNLLGPLTNPARPDRQVTGVGSKYIALLTYFDFCPSSVLAKPTTSGTETS